jgi:hypothetical protein
LLPTGANNSNWGCRHACRARSGGSLATWTFDSFLIGELNKVPYKSDERGIEWVKDAIDVCGEMSTGVILLAFFGKGALKEEDGSLDRSAKETKEVIRRLKNAAPKAEKANVSLGIESTLNAVGRSCSSISGLDQFQFESQHTRNSLNVGKLGVTPVLDVFYGIGVGNARLTDRKNDFYPVRQGYIKRVW